MKIVTIRDVGAKIAFAPPKGGQLRIDPSCDVEELLALLA